VDVAQVQARLPANAALVEFVRFGPFDFQAAAKKSNWKAPRYYAFVLTSGKAPPRLVDLGLAKDIDAGVEKLRQAFADFQDKLGDADTPAETHALEKKHEQEYRRTATALYGLVFAPLQAALGTSRRVYLAADGQVTRLPFEALVDEGGKYLVESREFVY